MHIPSDGPLDYRHTWQCRDGGGERGGERERVTVELLVERGKRRRRCKRDAEGGNDEVKENLNSGRRKKEGNPGEGKTEGVERRMENGKKRRERRKRKTNP